MEVEVVISMGDMWSKTHCRKRKNVVGLSVDYMGRVKCLLFSNSLNEFQFYDH